MLFDLFARVVGQIGNKQPVELVLYGTEKRYLTCTKMPRKSRHA